MKVMKAGFIGCGSIFKHYENIITNSIPGINIEAVCDIDINKKNYVSKIGASFYTNPQEMINENELDVCFVITPSGLHYQNALICIENKINTFIEKPITLRIEHAEELINKSKENNVILGVVYQNRFNKAIQCLKNLIDNDTFGKRILSNVSLLWSRDDNYYKGWRGTWLMDGGVMAQQAIHHLDILQWLNSPIEKVFCMEKTILNNLQAEDTAIGTISFDDNSMGSFQVTTALRPKDLEASITIIGEKGYIKVGGLALNKIIDIQLGGMDIDKEKFIYENSEIVEKGFGNGHIVYLNKIYESFCSGALIAPVSGIDALNSLKLLHALYLSSEEGKPLNFDINKKSQRLGK